MKAKPFFSVVIPTFNRAHTLERAIDSVLNQSFKDFELIVVDDGSDDETSEVLKKYENRIKIISIENGGVSRARNIGVSSSKADWLAFLDSDDEWLNDKLQIQFDQINESDFPLYHGEEIWVRNGKRINQKKVHKKSGGSIYLKCLHLCLISPSAVVIKKEVYNEFFGFDENFIVCEDYDLWLKITSKYVVGFTEKPLITKYGGHEDQLSAKYKAMDYYRVKSLKQMYESDLISEIERDKTREVLLKKAEILLNGYKKHNNMKNFEEISEIYESIKNHSL